VTYNITDFLIFADNHHCHHHHHHQHHYHYHNHCEWTPLVFICWLFILFYCFSNFLRNIEI